MISEFSTVDGFEILNFLEVSDAVGHSCRVEKGTRGEFS